MMLRQATQPKIISGARRILSSKTHPAVTPSEFRTRLLSHYEYHTGESDLRPVPSWPSVRYHALVINCVCKGARMARRGLYDDSGWEAASGAILLAVERLGGRLHVDGLRPLATLSQPCVIAANHMSALETYALACMLLPFCRATFVVKRSLLRYPVFGVLLRSLQPIGLSRSNPREDLKVLLREGARRLESGMSLVLFPQARRRAVFDPVDFNSIAAKLAGRVKVPLVPLALKTDFLARGFPLPDFGRVYPEKDVRFSFGPPLVAANREKEAHRETLDFVAQKLIGWNAAVKPVGSSPIFPGRQDA